jgi:DNA polymerase III subunit beta
MKIVCDREKLQDAYQTVAPVVPARSTKPIVQNVKIEAGPDGTFLLGTDIEISIRVQADGIAVDKPGEAVLHNSRFGSILRESNDETLTLDSDESGVKIKGTRSTFKLPSEDPREFPASPAFKQSAYHLVSAPLLRDVIRRTAYATDQESHRFALGGVLLEFSPTEITAVGTDGRRMAVMKCAAQAVGGHDPKDATTIVPARATSIIERALADETGECMLALQGSSLIVKSERTTISARLLEGKFPRWRDVFPQRSDVLRVEAPAGPLFAAIRQAAITTDEESQGIDFAFSEGTLTLAAEAAQTGASHVELPIAYSGEPLTICLNHKFLGQFFRVLNPESNVSIELQSAESAAVFSTEDGYRYVLMPLSRDEAG